MTQLMLRVLDGADRGRVYSDLAPPITIGREEGNAVQLNDDRVSRFHVKIQEDNDKLVLTDLESTNGTKVNGEHIQLRILRYGDMIKVGRSVLLFGSPAQIASRLRSNGAHSQTGEASLEAESEMIDFELSNSSAAVDANPAYLKNPPPLPDRLSPGQAAQLSEVLEFLHLQIRNLINSAKLEEKDGEDSRIMISGQQWFLVAQLQSQISQYLRHIGEPPAGESP